MITNMPPHGRLDSANAGCAAYGLIAHGFRYPDNEWLSLLMDANRWHGWPEQIAETHCDAAEPLSKLRVVVDHLKPPAALEQLQERFADLFGHAVRGKCPPYELEFGKSEVIQRASDLADISGFYAAFGLELTSDLSERPDHISVESEFLSVLCRKEACGIENEDRQLAEVVRDAHTQFLKSHLGLWLPAFAQRLRDSDPHGFYGRLAEFAAVFVARECAHFGIPAASTYLQLRSVDHVQEATQSCGVPGECMTATGEQLTQLHVAIDGEDG